MCATLREPSRGRSEGDVTSLRPIGYNETIMASSFNLNAYGAMFRVKAAYSFEVGGLLVRMYAFMRTIGTVSMLTLSGYSYFMAGLVASVVAFALFLISPRVSKKIDERGQGAIVVPATCIALSGCAVLRGRGAHGLSAYASGAYPCPLGLPGEIGSPGRRCPRA